MGCFKVFLPLPLGEGWGESNKIVAQSGKKERLKYMRKVSGLEMLLENGVL